MPPTSYFLTEKVAGLIAKAAFDTMRNWAGLGLVNREHGHLFIMNPAQPYGEDVDFVRAVLFEQSLRDSKEWEHDYTRIAQRKAELAWRTGVSTREAVFLYPHLLEVRDVRWPGGIVHHGIVVAYSGVHAPWDEAFAYMVAAMLEAYAREMMDRNIHPDTGADFLGRERHR